MSDIYRNFHEEIIEGFTVRLRFEDEHLDPTDIFDDEMDCKAIYEGNITWLCAIVEVFKCGVELAYTTLGAITYEWHKLEDFIKDEFQNLAQDAISEAKAKLLELCA